MASPVSHSLIGLAIGMARFLPPAASLRALARRTWDCRVPLLICVLLANAPDLDYLFGIPRGDLNLYHHSVTHTAVWIVTLAFAVWVCGWPDRSWGSLLFVLALLASHLAADFFTQDRSKPYGMMLGWPFCDQYCISSVSVFPAPAKRCLEELLTFHNFIVIMIEVSIVLPLVAAVAAFKLLRKQTGDEALGDSKPEIE